MKITFILPYAGLAGGIRVVAIYAGRLKKRGHKVTVISLPRRQLAVKQKIRMLLKEKKWPVQGHGSSHFDNVDVEHRILRKCRPITNADLPDADIVIATWWETAEWMNKFHPSKGVKFYFVQHHEIHKGLPIDRVKATYLMPFHKITISHWLMNIMAREYGDRDVTLVQNSVDNNFFKAPVRGRQSNPTVGFMYSTIDFKGCDIIIESLNEVRKSIPALRILVFGLYNPSADLALPLNSKFYCRPLQEKIREIYSSCDFWLFGSRTEGFGLPILEAMACRTPVIATKAGAAPELIAKGGGVLVNDWSAKTMAETIVSSFGLPEKNWKMMSEKGRKTVIDFTWDDATDLFEKALLEKI